MDIYLVLSCDCWLIHFLLPYANEIGICSRFVMASLEYQWANGLGNPFLNSSQPFYLGASEPSLFSKKIKIYSHTHPPPPLKNCASVLILSLIFNLILLQHLVWEMWACNLIDLVLQKSSHCPVLFPCFCFAVLLVAHLVRDATSCIMFLVAIKLCPKCFQLFHQPLEIKVPRPLLFQIALLLHLWSPVCAINTTQLRVASSVINAILPMVSGSLGRLLLLHMMILVPWGQCRAGLLLHMMILVPWGQCRAGWVGTWSIHTKVMVLQQALGHPLLLRSVLMLHLLEPSLGKMVLTLSISVVLLEPSFP